MRVLVDAQAFQNPWSARRGIGRYLRELLTALEQAEQRARLYYVLNPDLEVPAELESRLGKGGWTFSDELAPVDGDVFHIPSPFEPAPIDRVWPPAVRGLPLVVTVHDLIPFVLTDLYLQSPSERSWFRARLELVRHANRVIAVSESTARDLVERAGIARHRIVVTGEGSPEHFEPARDRDAALTDLQAELPEVRADFVLYQGGMDYRKNTDRLLGAYAGLPSELRRRHQLVVVCELNDEQRERIQGVLAELDVQADVLFPGYVPDETLVRLFQTAKLSVFPSLYEGYGLPVAESIACRTPVIASRTSSIPELIEDEEALFDPYDPASIRKTLRRALDDEAFLERLRKARLDERHTWPEVARQTERVYAAAGSEQRFLRPRRRRLAIALAFPRRDPQQRPTYRLLAALAQRFEVDAFVRPASQPFLPPGVEKRRLPSFQLVERARGGYDAVVSILDHDTAAAELLPLIRARGGQVVLQCPDLIGLYAWAAEERPDIEPRGFAGAVRMIYEDRLPEDLREGEISPEDAARHGLRMTAEVAAAADRVIVLSEDDRRDVEHDVAAADAHKLTVVPGDSVEKLADVIFA